MSAAQPIRPGGLATRDSIADVWGPRTPHLGSWPVREDERVLETPERWVSSVCVLFSTGCGIDIGVAGGRMVGVRGRATDRVSHGRLDRRAPAERMGPADSLARRLLHRS